VVQIRLAVITNMNAEAKFYAEVAVGMISRRVGKKFRMAKLFFGHDKESHAGTS